METQVLGVQGMSCDACVGHVTRALRALDGVQAADVNLDAARAMVTFDPAKVQISQMVTAVENEGYEASV